VIEGRPLVIWKARDNNGVFEPLEITPEGGKRIPYDAYLRGLR
jgi:hypothetical protein